MPTREQVAAFIDPQQRSDNGWTFDAELGWIHCNAVHNDGVHGTNSHYTYESDGARTIVNFSGQPCRIHAYGNSFTHCDQVNNGETWMEYLAAHFQEPIRNYGVGGYSVYQAYRRMIKVEKTNPADYIILNIWSDDHFRNLDAWRSIRFGKRTRCGYTLPHLRVNRKEDRCEQIDNIFHSPQELYQLCDPHFVSKTFEKDYVLNLMFSATTNLKTARMLTGDPRIAFGLPKEKNLDMEMAQQIAIEHMENALYATRQVVTWFEQFVQETGKKMLVIMSYGSPLIAADLRKQPRFDETFIRWLHTRSFPIIDMRNMFRSDFTNSNLDIDDYLDQYYNGHHTPRGNFFTAWTIKNSLCKWLNPMPLPYQSLYTNFYNLSQAMSQSDQLPTELSDQEL